MGELMKMKLMMAGLALLGSSLAFAQEITCPTITSRDVEDIISQGIIQTNQAYTLADEAGMSRADVILSEPTANPFDTYYSMYYFKKVGDTNFVYYIGNVLGKVSFEAQERARKVFSEASYDGRYNKENQACMYREINASPSIANYPFKSSYETMVLISVPMRGCQGDSCQQFIPKTFLKGLKK